MAETWTGKEPQMSPQQLHILLTSLNVIRLQASYSGAGDSADSFSVQLDIDPDKADKSLVEKLTAAQHEKFKSSWRVRNGYKTLDDFKPDFTCIAPEQLNLDADMLRDILAASVVHAGGAWNFNEDGCSGNIEWDLVTNECALDSGYYETIRQDDGHCSDDLFGFGVDAEDD